MVMALEGTLEEFNIVAVLQMVAGSRMTGSLLLWDAANKATLVFAQGLIIHADSTQQADRLGEVLVRTHRITRAQLEKATSAQLRQRSGQRLGQILRDMNLVTDEDLAMVMQIKIHEIMSRLLLWTRGRWQFRFETVDADAEIPSSAISVEDVLSGQMVMLDDDPGYDTQAMLDEVYSIVQGRARESERIIIEADEWAVLSAVDGRASVGEIAGRIGMEPEQACEIVADLVAVRLIARSPAPVPEQSAAPAPAPMAAGPFAGAGTLVMDAPLLDGLGEILAVLLARTEGIEVCLIDASGSLMARRGREAHIRYPGLFALTAGIFASWQELGRCLGESKVSTLLYQGAGLNICFSPVGAQALLMTLYQQTANSGLVNFWSREASARIGRLLAPVAAGAPLPPSALANRAGPPAALLTAGAPGAGPPAAPGALGLDAAFQAEVSRQLEELFRT
jgi:predicted regulator of Ras-like GTPase activity (Roadblock/LC7/MglB family)